MKKINENAKVTLTLSQLKKIVKESVETLSDEEVNKLEDALRAAQDAIESAGRIVCNVSGEVGPQIWGKCNRISSEISELFDSTYRLRAW